MGWAQVVRIALAASTAAALVACGFADSHAPLPSFMRQPEPEVAPEPTPHVKQLVHDNLESVFVSTSNARDVQVSQPLRNPRGAGWTACVRAAVTSANGQPIGVQTYRIFIVEGTIADRRRVDADDNCLTENYEPI